jgi:sugar/nucleoside kinase (ribokinase family)
MNPLFWEQIPSLVKGITVFSTSETKLRSLFHARSVDLWEMAELIGSFGCEQVVIKRGSQGQWVYETASHSRWMIPAYPARAMDPTGCGDVFCGSFLAIYRSTYNVLEAALAGNIAASLAIEGVGAFYVLDAMPGLARYRIDALRGMVRKA